MTIREQNEALEEQLLSDWATKSSRSRGRVRQEPPCPVRTAFQRDRDRIVHSKAFRRLKHKTQVFLDPGEDHYRTRLTHTLEVAQIARTVARALRLNEDLTEAIALGHDLGHPPFGHTGEAALDALMKAHGQTAGFRHYEQSLRVVDALENDGKGLNLTYETREGIAGHSKGASDLGQDEATRASSPEAAVVRLSDRIAYLNHDLDDAKRAGLLSDDDLPKTLTERLGSGHSQRIAAMVVDLVDTSQQAGSVAFSPPMLEAMNEMKTFMFETVYQNPKVINERERAEGLIGGLFRHYIQHPETLPEGFVPTSNEPIEIKICDYIAGMTDRYAIQIYERLFLPRPWTQP